MKVQESTVFASQKLNPHKLKFNAKPLNVAVISTLYPNESIPTRGVFTAHIVGSLKSYCNVLVISPLPWFPRNRLFNKFKNWREFTYVPKHDYMNGVEVYYPRYFIIPKFFTFLHPLFMLPPLYFLLLRLKHQGKVDVIKTHWIFPDGVASTIVSKILGIGQVLVALGCDITHFPFLPFRGKQIVWALRKADTVMVVSEDLGRRVEKLGAARSKIKLAPDGVAFCIFKIYDRDLCRDELSIPKDATIILQVASLDEVKATRYLVEAAAILKKVLNKKLYVYVIGDGHLKNDLVKQARLLGVDDIVSFEGCKSHEDIAKWMNIADVFCLTSIREGRPNVVIESIACGVPVVASAVGGVPELINSDNGFLTEPENPDDIAKKLKMAIDKEWDRSKIASTVSHLTWDKAGKIYYDVLCKAVKSCNGK